MNRSTLGNTAFLDLPKTAFLCSRKVPASIILRSFDWAKGMCDAQRCVITGNHSPIEKDVFHFLLKGRQPLILALARGMIRTIDPVLKNALSGDRLLIVTPFKDTARRASEESAVKRNAMMTEMAQEIFIAYAYPGGNVEREAIRSLRLGKKVVTFDVRENATLIKAGAELYSIAT